MRYPSKEVSVRQSLLAQGDAAMNWPKKLDKIKVYGKTGTLGARNPDRTYTWFVDYIKGSNRDIALAVLAINGTK